jgi:hypothetical protein
MAKKSKGKKKVPCRHAKTVVKDVTYAGPTVMWCTRCGAINPDDSGWTRPTG